MDYGFLRSPESRHTLRFPLPLWNHVSELTQGVGSTCGVMISCAAISLSWVSISFLATMETLCSAGGTLGSCLMEYSPGIQPICQRNLGPCSSGF